MITLSEQNFKDAIFRVRHKHQFLRMRLHTDDLDDCYFMEEGAEVLLEVCNQKIGHDDKNALESLLRAESNKQRDFTRTTCFFSVVFDARSPTGNLKYSRFFACAGACALCLCA